MRLSALHAAIAGSILVWSAPAFAQTDAATLAGDWSGALDIQGTQLRLVLHVKTADGKTTATLDSLDQQAMDIPVSAITRDGAKMTFEVAIVGGHYAGTLSSDARSVAGTWSQNGAELPLDLKRP
jgi:hypothetical protein